VGGAVGTVVAGYSAWKGLQIALGLSAITKAWMEQTAAVQAHTKAVAADNAASGGAAAAGKGSLRAPTLSGMAGAAMLGLPIGLGIAQFADEKGFNPFRKLLAPAYEKITGVETSTSAKDARMTDARKAEYSAQFDEFSNDIKGISSLKERDDLIEKTKKKIEALNSAVTEEGGTERTEVGRQVEVWENMIATLQGVTQARIDHTTAVQKEAQALGEAIEKSRHLADDMAAQKSKIEDIEAGTSAGMAHAKVKQQFKEAQDQTGIKDFLDTPAVEALLKPWQDRQAEIKGRLERSEKAKPILKEHDAEISGAVNMSPEYEASLYPEIGRARKDALPGADERDLKHEAGTLSTNIARVLDQWAKGAAAQQKKQESDLKLAEAQDRQALEIAKEKKDFPEIKRLEDKQTRDKALAEFSQLPIDSAQAGKMADQAVAIANAEKTSAGERFLKEQQIADLRKKGREKEADNLEREMLVAKYREDYHFDEKTAREAADKTMKGEHRPREMKTEVDSYTRIGLFTGGGTNPLVSIQAEHLSIAKKTLTAIEKLNPTTSKSLIGRG
jgi:hypothetical protein